MQAEGEQYPAWVLDQMGVETMLANRVEMGSSIQPPRFRWVPYADALMFPLDNSASRSESRTARHSSRSKTSCARATWRSRSPWRRPPRSPTILPAWSLPRSSATSRAARWPKSSRPPICGRLHFDAVDRAAAERVYARFIGKAPLGEPTTSPCRISCSATSPPNAAGWAWPSTSTRMAGAGGYFDVQGANPLQLESVLNDPALRKTKFVHGARRLALHPRDSRRC